MSYGIPLAAFPINTDGTLKTAWNRRLLEVQREKEDQETSRIAAVERGKGVVFFPTQKDILLGRGKPYQDYPGNISLGKFVEAHRNRYQKATAHLEKLCIATNVVHMIQESGCRFLKRKEGIGWVIQEDSVAIQKVGQSLRAKFTQKATKESETAVEPEKSIPKRARRHQAHDTTIAASAD